ncbi:ANTAR domain-containing response regulator [Noviherbaspirillum aridicola]|uniref:Response regulator n=1 Tax=Noviherbaspirillum aridicola TaxID=2849687 RepID=A0ABQ4Q8D1_9BURK|nr:response regulator [Noviherbaspirillum aridicola]GIZ53035.1 response regulator [Noviherbaspirillum aridicola]
MLKVAVIDANAISRSLLTSVLDGGGFEVVGGSNTSSSGMAGLVRLQPQLVCIDIGTHDEEGFARLAWLREQLPKSLLFLVSGTLDAPTVQKAAGLGVHGFIVKPFNGSAVIASIRNAVIKLARQHRATPSNSADAS